MAVRAAIANGNLTAAGSWGLVDATSYNNSEAANSAVTTSPVASSAFAPGAITVDGVGVKIASRTASPTGTFTIELFNSSGTVSVASVTVNVSDVPQCTATSGSTTPVGTAEGGWFFVKFGAPVTLLAATNYTIRVSTSSSSQINLWSLATTNWSRFLRTTTTGAPGVGDDMIITGEWTAAATMTARSVTQDSTAATDYGSNTTSQVTPAMAICKGGTLTYGTSTTTAYILRLSGYLVVYSGGTLSVGASGGEIPRGSSAQLQFDCTADGDFGLTARRGSAVNMAGLSRTLGNNTVITKLAANAAAGATALTTAVATGWLSGDNVCYAPTSQTATQYEAKTLTTNASGTSLTSNALTNAHAGTSPTQAEVGLLTRNVLMTGVTANVVTFLYVADTAIINLSFAEFQWIGTNASGKLGWNITTITGTFNADSCSVHDCDTCGVALSGATLSNVAISNLVLYNTCIAAAGNGALIILNATSGTWSITNSMICGMALGNASMVQLNDVGGVFTGNSLSGGQGASTSGGALALLESRGVIGTIGSIEIHSNTNAGIAPGTVLGTMTSVNSWRNTTYGMNAGGLSSTSLWTLDGFNFFGNSTAGVLFGNASQITLADGTINGDTTFPTTSAFLIGGSVVYLAMRLFSVVTSVVSGIKTACTNDFNGQNQATALNVVADNCGFNSTNLFLNIGSIYGAGEQGGSNLGAMLQVENLGQIANVNRSWFSNGTSTPSIVQSNSSTVYLTNPLSQEIQPKVAGLKVSSSSLLCATPSGKTATMVVQVQVNVGYNGNAPRLLLRRQDSMGVVTDQVLATWSGSPGSWVSLSGSSPSAPQDGVYEFVVDCDGTAGSCFLGDAVGTVA